MVRYGVILKHYVNGKNFGTGQKWSETRGGPLIKVVRNRGYTVLRQLFSTLVGIGFGSHDLDDELKISFFCRTLKIIHFGSNFCFFALIENILYFVCKFGTDSCILYPQNIQRNV